MKEKTTRNKDIHCLTYNNKHNAATVQETRCSINKPELLSSYGRARRVKTMLSNFTKGQTHQKNVRYASSALKSTCYKPILCVSVSVSGHFSYCN